MRVRVVGPGGNKTMLRRQRIIRVYLHQILDALLFAVGFWLAHLLRAQWPNAYFPNSDRIESFAAYYYFWFVILPFSVIFLETQGFYTRPVAGPRLQTAWQLFRASFFMVVFVIVVAVAVRVQLARSVLILFGVISFGLVFAKEELIRAWGMTSLGRAQNRRRLILVGSAEDTDRLAKELREGEEHGVEVLHEHSANGVLLTAKHTYFGQIEKVIEVCELEGVEVWLLADFFKTQISRTSMDDFNGRPTLVFRSTPEASWQGLAKQLLDTVGALVMLLVLAPLFVVVAALVKGTSPGPVFFRQERSGLNGRPFTMLKFRSMFSDAEQRKAELAAFNEMEGPVFKVTNDPRITPLGRFLRKWSIDEMPQFWNVLRGEMSLVGPRPLPVDEVRRFDDLAHRRRLSVKPGITCLWQVSGRNNVTDFKDWVRLDLEYIDNWSLWLDLKILLLTIPAVFSGTGAR
jgi:lipopolysaccharide/colanic/teichoic acid biosynthesis glycosyltransferase